jgi:RNA polymerase sigma-70 factor, ECF subfamily
MKLITHNQFSTHTAHQSMKCVDPFARLSSPESNRFGAGETRVSRLGSEPQGLISFFMNTTAPQPGLIDRVAQSDPDAMQVLIKKYAGLVWSLVRRKVNNAVDAEDLVQEIFADIWKSSKRYDAASGSEDTFIAMIARRRVIDYIRKVGRRTPQVPFDGFAEHTASEEKQSGKDVDIRPIMEVLSSLRPERRQVIELSVVQGLSHSQIAESTQMPLGTVKAHLRRGLEEVRKTLQSQSAAKSEPDESTKAESKKEVSQ